MLRRLGAGLAVIAAVATALVIVPGADAETASAPPAAAAQAGSIAAGYVNSCVVLTTGAVRCWGAADQGVLGQGTGAGTNGSLDIGDDELPTAGATVALGAGRTARSISLRYRHACAVLDNGAVRCWGNGEAGVVGTGTAVIGDDELPTAIPTVDLGPGRTAKAVTAGWHQSCAILDNDAVRCWGQNNSGQLGIGSAGQDIGDDESPATVPTLDLGAGATAVSSGRFHTCAILAGGSVRCWGVNNHGQLGRGNTENIGDDESPSAGSPVDLGAGRTAVALAAGYEHTCAILDNGSLRCWGLNNQGQLGLGTTANLGDDEAVSSVAPVALGAGRTAVAVTAGYDNTCVVLDDGTARCWGSNHVAQLGLGTSVPLQPGEVLDPMGTGATSLGDNEAPTAMPVIDLGATPTAIATGTYHSCALLTTQDVKCWGAGSNGRTGYGDDARRGDDESPSAYGNVSVGGSVGATPTSSSTTTTSTTTTTAPTTTAPTTTAAPSTTAPPDTPTTTAPPTTAPPTTTPPAPKDTQAPRLILWRGSPASVGNGTVCVFLTSDEVAISAFAIQVPGKGEFRSAVGGVGPTFPRFTCITLPKSARPKRATASTFVGAGLDAAGNLAFDVRPVVLVK